MIFLEMSAKYRFLCDLGSVKLFFTIWLFSICLGLNLYSEEYAGKFTSVVPHESPFINYGPCFLNDTLQIKFTVKNTGEKPLWMTNSVPAFYLGLSPNGTTNEQWTLFSRLSDLRKSFQPGQEDTIRINFLAKDTLITKPGWHEALLAMSLLPSDELGAQPISKIDTFFLRVKKTIYFVSGYEDDIDFDSVYIFPNIIPHKTWRVKNVWTKNQPVIKLEPLMITQPVTPPEIIVQDLPQNTIDIYPDSIIYLDVQYYPQDRGMDSMYLKLLYHPLKSEFPDSVDYAWSAIKGIGVEQKLSIAYSTHNAWNDTIFLGDNIKLDDTLSIEVSLKNDGNLPFGVKSQVILNDTDDNEHPDIKFVNKFQTNGLHLNPQQQMVASLELKPSDIGYFAARIRIESDIFDRNIQGVQPDKRYKYIYLKGFVRSPRLEVRYDEIDMGNVIVSSTECPSNRDTVIKIYNTGNEILSVSITISPTGKFFASQVFMDINPNSSDTLLVSFIADGDDFNSYEANIKFESNTITAMTKNIKLKARSIPPIAATLGIPQNLRTRPGTQIEVPVTLISNGTRPAQFAKSFKTTLFYNRSLLEFAGIRTIGTAAQGAVYNGDSIENPETQELKLDIRTLGTGFFMARDTLIFLKFRTYLGDAIATEISFIEPKFGDGNCDNIFTLLKTNGVYYTDSVCGIAYKALPSISGKFNLKVVSNIASGRDDIEFELPYSTFTVVKILDIFGQEVKTLISSEMTSGKYQIEADVTGFLSGMYLIELTTPAIRLIQPFPVSK